MHWLTCALAFVAERNIIPAIRTLPKAASRHRSRIVICFMFLFLLTWFIDRTILLHNPACTIAGVHRSGKRSRLNIMPMWKKVAIMVVAWAGSVLVYLEFFAKGR